MDEISHTRALLRIARPENGAASEPALADALRQAEQDPSLQELLASEAAFDRKIAAELRSGMAVPAGLRERLLALDPARSPAPAESIPFPPQPRPSRTWSVSLTSLAAAAAVLFAGALILRSPPTGGPPEPGAMPPTRLAADPLTSLVQAVSARLTSLPDYEFRASEFEDVRRFLSDRSAPAPMKVPAGLRHLKTEGCVTFQVEDSQVTLITFTGDSSYRLFIVRRRDFPGCTERYRPAIEQVAGRAVAAWTCNQALYFVTSDAAEADLASLL